MSDENKNKVAQAAASLAIAYCIWNVGRAIYHRPIVCAVIAAVFLVVCLMTGDSYIEVINMGCGFLMAGSLVFFVAYVAEYPIRTIWAFIVWAFIIVHFFNWMNGIPNS